MQSLNKEYFAAILQLFEDFTVKHQELTVMINNNNTLEELADIAYTLQRCRDMLHSMHKQASGSFDLVTRFACVKWAQRGEGEPIRTEYCTVTPSVRMCAKVPRKEDESYEALMNHLGVNSDMLKYDTVRPHWPGLVDYITERLTEGKPLPPGVDPNTKYPVYSITIRKKKGITE
jgi:hypothetical protein